MTSVTRNTTFIALASAVTLTTLGLVILSPLALRAFASNSNVNWKALSDVGQTYGAISALLATLALVGVSLSVILQARQTRYARWETSRSRHGELVRFALEHPHYQQVFGVSADSSRALFAYLNLMLQHWMTLWEFKDMSERQLRRYLHDVFSTEAGRSYWARVDEERSTDLNTRRERQFHQIACQEFELTEAIRPTATPHSIQHPDKRMSRTTRAIIPWIVGGACGVAVSRLVGGQIGSKPARCVSQVRKF